jgi:hypothetical protein
VFSRSCLTEEGIKRVIATTDCLVARHLAIGLNPVFKTVQLPTGISNLNTSLTNVD